MRLLLYNPNTDASLTARLSLAMARSLAPGDELKTSTSNKGASFIGSAETIAVAKGALLRDLPARAEGCDAIVLGCFGDLGIATLRRRLGLPIVSLSDVVVSGITPAARFWTLTLYNSRGRLVSNSLQRYGFTSQEIIRGADGSFEVRVASRSRAGNWLPTGGIERYSLVLRLYDTPVGVATRTQRDAPMPAIVTVGCP